MKTKYLKILLMMAFLLVVLVACNGNGDDNGNGGAADENGTEATTAYENGTEPADVGGDTIDVNVFLIAHSPAPYSTRADGSFNQGAEDGIDRFIASNPGTSFDFLQPHEASDEARIDIIQDAIDQGANIIVLPGFHFQNALYDAQDLFPDVKFVLLDASPRHPETEAVRVENNVAAIHYAEEQSGFLAGYAAVMEGYRDLGFLGGLPVPAVMRFGHGFIQGAEFAAESLGLEEGEVTIDFRYLGGFGPTPEFQTLAAGMYAAGVEVIFVAAGGAGNSVMAAAEAAGTSVIGVDVDQYHLSDTIVTSALKELAVSVYDMLTDFANGNFNGGQELRFEASNNGIGLAMDTARLQNFTQAQYDAIFARLAGGEINVSASMDMSDIETTLVTVNEQ